MKIITQREHAFFLQFIQWFKEKTDTDLTNDFKEFCAENTRIIDKRGRIINPMLILSVVSRELLISETMIISKIRKRELVEARTIMASILLSEGNGVQAVGIFLGGRDHSTVIHMRKNHGDLIQYDHGYRSKFNKVLDTLQNNGVLINMP